MKSSEELRSQLRSIDHRGYPAYKSLAGSYQFPGFSLIIDHVRSEEHTSELQSLTGRPFRVAFGAPCGSCAQCGRVSEGILCKGLFPHRFAGFPHEAACLYV